MSLGDPLSGRELAAFVSAVELGSFQAAADALALTQSAASKRLLALERRLGQPMLERHHDGVRPTAAGRLLYPAAREALAALARAEACLSQNAERPTLRIQASRTVGETLLPQWIAAFRDLQPDAHIYVDVTNSADVLEAVREGEVEVGFVEGPAATRNGLKDLVVAEDEIVVVVAAEHPWGRRRSIPVSALRGECFFAREQGSRFRYPCGDRCRAGPGWGRARAHARGRLHRGPQTRGAPRRLHPGLSSQRRRRVGRRRVAGDSGPRDGLAAPLPGATALAPGAAGPGPAQFWKLLERRAARG